MAKKKKVEEEAPPPDLTDKQRAFVAYFFENGGNATAAYKKAYGSPKGATESAHSLLQSPVIRAVVAERRAQLSEKFKVTEEAITARLAAHAFTTLADLMRDDPGSYRTFRIKDWAAMDPQHAAAIKTFSESTGETDSQSIAMHDPTKAIELLVKYLNLFPNAKGSKKDGSGSGISDEARKAARARIRTKFGLGG